MEARPAGQGAHPRLVRGGARRSAAPTRCIRSRRCRPNIRCCTAPRPRRRARQRAPSVFGFVAYAPLGRGFLTGAIKTFDDVDGRRAAHPRFQKENFDRNRELVAKIEAIAAEKGCTPAQLTLAWLLARGDWGDPRNALSARLDENLGALRVSLTRRKWRGSPRRSPGRRRRHALSGRWDAGGVPVGLQRRWASLRSHASETLMLIGWC